MLSILGGEWSGRRLKALDRKDLRPTLGRVKSSIFSIVESIEWKRSGSPDFSHWRCLDLFAGVGGLGLEALSRGANFCVFVEKDKRHAQVLKENISTLGCESRCEIFIEDALKGSWLNRGPYHFVMIDPPYAYTEFHSLLAKLGEANCLLPGAIVMLEHDAKTEMPAAEGFTLHSSRKLGPAGISILVRNA